LGSELSSLGESVNEPAISYMPKGQLGSVSYLRGDFAMAREHFKHAEEGYDRDRHLPLTRLTGYDLRVFAYAMSALMIWQLGYPDQAAATGQKAVEAADTLQHFESAAIARCMHVAGPRQLSSQ
jgi:hypothetical protein